MTCSAAAAYLAAIWEHEQGKVLWWDDVRGCGVIAAVVEGRYISVTRQEIVGGDRLQRNEGVTFSRVRGGVDPSVFFARNVVGPAVVATGQKGVVYKWDQKARCGLGWVKIC